MKGTHPFKKMYLIKMIKNRNKTPTRWVKRDPDQANPDLSTPKQSSRQGLAKQKDEGNSFIRLTAVVPPCRLLPLFGRAVLWGVASTVMYNIVTQSMSLAITCDRLFGSMEVLSKVPCQKVLPLLGGHQRWKKMAAE